MKSLDGATMSQLLSSLNARLGAAKSAAASQSEPDFGAIFSLDDAAQNSTNSEQALADAQARAALQASVDSASDANRRTGVRSAPQATKRPRNASDDPNAAPWAAWLAPTMNRENRADPAIAPERRDSPGSVAAAGEGSNRTAARNAEIRQDVAARQEQRRTSREQAVADASDEASDRRANAAHSDAANPEDHAQGTGNAADAHAASPDNSATAATSTATQTKAAAQASAPGDSASDSGTAAATVSAAGLTALANAVDVTQVDFTVGAANGDQSGDGVAAVSGVGTAADDAASGGASVLNLLRALSGTTSAGATVRTATGPLGFGAAVGVVPADAATTGATAQLLNQLLGRLASGATAPDQLPLGVSAGVLTSGPEDLSPDQSVLGAAATTDPRFLTLPADPGMAATSASAGATATGKPSTLTLGQPGWAADLVNRVQSQVAEARHEARIELHPQELGAMMIRVSLQGAATQVQFVAENPAARAALHAALPQLQQMFSAAGLTLGQVSVGSQFAGDSSFSGGANSHFSAQTQSSGDRHSSALLGDTTVAPTTRRNSATTQLDDYA